MLQRLLKNLLFHPRGVLAWALLCAAALQAADAQNHWAFLPLQPVAAPAVQDSWVRTDIDRFILEKLQAAGIRPNAEMDRVRLIRRVTMDLTGLPPSPEEVDSFAGDQAPDAYEKLVDRLLASPHYGERWGRHWLDVARYADSMGYRFDDDMPWAFQYRDWVIRSLNEDMPYDRFVRWQLAGDELAQGDLNALAATGFAAIGPRERDEGTKKNRLETRYIELDDIVSTTSSAFLALTVGCCRCHDHKTDPIPQREYYQLTSAFLSARRGENYFASPAEVAAYRQAAAQLDRDRAELAGVLAAWIRRHEKQLRPEIDMIISDLKAPQADKKLIDKKLDPADKKQAEAFLKNRTGLGFTPGKMRGLLGETAAAELAAIAEAQDRLKKREPDEPPKCMTYLDDGPTPEQGHILNRGLVDQPGDPVSLGFLSALTPAAYPLLPRPEKAKTTYQRASLAQWITDTDRGAGRLLARVMANRLWHYHFGEGLVRTPNDFGATGDRPEHSQLLDYLSNELIRHGWSLKSMHRLILTSAVYRQSIAYDEKRAAVDPENRLWWRRRPVRIESEILRDSVLAVSGRLNTQMYGPGVKVPIPDEAIITRTAGDDHYPKGVPDGPAVWRRGVYRFIKRTVPEPMNQVFDGADPSASCERRIYTTVAPQALSLMNSPFVRDRSRDLADRLIREAGEADQNRVDRAYRLTLGRAPTAAEQKQAQQFLAEQAQRRSGDRRAALADFSQVLLGLNEFSFID